MIDNVVLYSHGGSGNHGCEALVRSTYAVLKNVSERMHIELISGSVEEDKSYLGELCPLRELIPGRRNPDFLRAYLDFRIKGRKVSLDTYPYWPIIRSLSKDTVALSIGGDNYCYGNSDYYAELNRMFRRKGYKTVLWGCSVSRESLNEKAVVDDLKSYSLITARESLTYDALKSEGLTNVELYPDPAFTLNVDYPIFPVGFKGNGTVGINVSPMIQDNEKISGMTMQNYVSLVRMILNDTDYDIALIPHVVWKKSDDRKPLSQLYNEFSGSGRVIMIEDDNAERLKGVISKCHLMVAARTHASIAAYSTCVPTLVVGYSVKAKGIAQDIFGSYEDYVLPVQNLEKPDDLADKFKWIMDHETEIRNHLEEFMPGYIARAWEAGEALKKI